MEKKEKKYDEIFKVVEDMPRFPSCENKGLGKREIKECAQDSMLNFIYKNIKYPEEARKNNIEGRVYIQFVVEKDGSLANIKVLKDPSTGVLGEEAKRVIQLMNDRNIKWIPGKQRGKPVKVSYTLPIKFSL